MPRFMCRTAAGSKTAFHHAPLHVPHGRRTPFYPSTLLPFSPTTLLPFYPPTLLPFSPAALLPFYPSTLVPCSPSTLSDADSAASDAYSRLAVASRPPFRPVATGAPALGGAEVFGRYPGLLTGHLRLAFLGLADAVTH